MKAKTKTLVVASVILIGTCSSNIALGDAGEYNIDCEHAKVGKVIGINCEILSDTNRFEHGSSYFDYTIKLDKSVFGCDKANIESRVYSQLVNGVRRMKLEELSVSFKKTFESDMKSNVLMTEFQRTCDAITDLLDVESVKVGLVDVDLWKKKFRRSDDIGCVKTYAYFHLAGGQVIMVTAKEGTYVMRNGESTQLAKDSVEVKVLLKSQRFAYRSGSGADDVGVEKILNIGEDCSEKIATEMKADDRGDGPSRRSWIKAKRKSGQKTMKE